MKLWIQGILSILLALGLAASPAVAGEWVLHLERQAVITQRDIAIGYGSVGNGPLDRIYQVHTNLYQVYWDQDLNKEVVLLNGQVQPGNYWTQGVGLWWNNGTPTVNNQDPKSYQPIPTQSLAKMTVTPVFHWRRDNANDNPPETLYYIERVSVTGTEGVRQHDGWPVNYNLSNRFTEKYLHFQDVKHPYDPILGGVGAEAERPDAARSGETTNGFFASYHFTAHEDGSDFKVFAIKSEGKEDVRGVSRTFKGKLTAQGYQDQNSDMHGYANLYFGYSAEPCQFSLEVSTSEIARSKNLPRDKELEAFASPNWLGQNPNATEAAIEFFQDGYAEYNTYLSNSLVQTLGNLHYDWDTNSDTVTAYTFDNYEIQNGRGATALGTPDEEKMWTSTPNKKVHHNAGKKNDRIVGNPQPIWRFPTDTTTNVSITGTNSEKSKLTAKVKLNWYQKPQTRLRTETYVLVHDYDTGQTTRYGSLEEALQGSPEEQQIDAYIAEIQAAYKETIETGATAVGTALEVEKTIGSWYVPDETDVALFVVGGVAKKVFKIAKNSAKFAEVVTKVGEKLASKKALILAALKAKHSEHNIQVEVREALYVEERIGHTGRDGIRSSELPSGHASHEESGLVDDKLVCEMADGACFVAGTLVSTENGLRSIESIKAGERVWSRDEASGKTELKPVVRTFERHSATLVLTFANGETIEATKEHPFYVESEGFKKAGELGIGSAIVTRAGPTAKLISATSGHEQTVYNFEVQDFHTYFVGNGRLWVHNAWCGNWSHLSRPTWGHIVLPSG